MRSLRVLFLPRGGVERAGGGARAACDHRPAPPRAAPAAARWRPRMRACRSPGAGKGGGDRAGGAMRKRAAEPVAAALRSACARLLERETSAGPS